MTEKVAFSPDRRAFLRGRAENRAAFRPPWAIAKTDFVDACTACDACISACPEHVLIAGEGGYPHFDPSHGECVFCRQCVDACESGALDGARDQPWAIKADIADTCLARNGVTCFSCRDACGEAAIRFRPALGGAHPDLDAALCTGCGACVGICPVSAITLSVAEAAHG